MFEIIPAEPKSVSKLVMKTDSNIHIKTYKDNTGFLKRVLDRVSFRAPKWVISATNLVSSVSKQIQKPKDNQTKKTAYIEKPILQVSANEITQNILSEAQKLAGDDLRSDSALMEAGLNSLEATELVRTIGDQHGTELSATLLFDHPL